MTTLFETLEGRNVFSSTPIEVEMGAEQMFMETPTMPLLHDATVGRMQRPAPHWVDAIDPDFFVKPPLARAG
jgi:hypothetical protein